MPFTLTMPKLSPTMETGTLVKWHKKVGDHIEPGELLFEVSTDKATVEHQALDGGWLRKILIEEGQEAQVNQPVAILTESKDESIEGYKPEGLELKPAVPTTTEAPTEAMASPTPTVKPVTQMAQAVFVPEPPLAQYEFEQPRDLIEGRIKASPLAKKIAKEKGLDISTVNGSGPHGRVVSEDLTKAQPQGKVVFGRRDVPQLAPGSFVEETLQPIRKVVAQRLQEAKSFIPHFYVEMVIDAEPIVSIRSQLNSQEMKITFNDFVVRASALALREHPIVNSGFNSVNQTIVHFKTIDISIAVNIDLGLITPIVRHADYKNLGEISTEVKYLAKRAKDGKLEPQEFKGGSFTISNLGMYGVSQFQAIINPPQAAILAVSGILDTPVVKEGKVVPGKTMSLTLSVDHRVIDGVEAAKFLNTLKKYLENPALLLI